MLDVSLRLCFTVYHKYPTSIQNMKGCVIRIYAIITILIQENIISYLYHLFIMIDVLFEMIFTLFPFKHDSDFFRSSLSLVQKSYNLRI